MTDWKPKRTLQECDRIITAPGSVHELETRVVNGRVQRVYKNMWPSLRAFWLWACEEHKDKTFIVYGSERHTYSQALARSAKAAHMLRAVHGIRKGDRVAIASRNYPEYMVVFWACHLIGAVPVLVNAWLPQDGLVFCIGHTQSKVLIMDPERADVLAPVVKELSKNGTTTILVLEDDNKTWPGMKSWKGSLQECKDEGENILKENIEILPEDNATIFFTSGTTGRPKGVLSTQRQYLTNILNVMIASMRSILRDGEDLVPPPPGPQGGILISVPFFHVTGTSSQAMGAIAGGNKIVLMRSWNPKEAVRLIKAENVVTAGGVPSMVADLLEIGGFSLDVLSFGGAPASKMLPASITKIAKGAKAWVSSRLHTLVLIDNACV
ncbi:hypothetical protein PM082_016909 [Marasmius tenuissimus]|nr:hypothetical protein PM082_016909 [Marasmius tenuissimus]